MRWLWMSLLAAFVAAAASATAAEKVPLSTVTYKSGDENVQATLAVPSGEGPFPAVVLIHEWWGLNDWVKGNAARFAEKGYVALAVDLYRGKVAEDSELAHELSRGLAQDQAEGDLQAAVAYLRTRKDVNPKRIGAIGWCMGGGYSLSLALKQADLTSAVVCYGRLVTDKAALGKIGASILGIFGGQDRGIPVEGVRKFEASLRELKKDVTIHVYDAAGHAFMNSNNKSGYRKEDADDAWTRIDAFFKRTLQETPKN